MLSAPRSAFVAAFMSVTVAGCTSGTTETSAPGAGSGTATPARADLPRGAEPVHPDPTEFTTTIDNPYWPMGPGTRWTYRETDGGGATQKVVVVVTYQTKKMANGVTARVVRDTVTKADKVIEDTRDWYAQDRRGNIWYLGEETAEFEDGKVTTRAGSFEAGVDGAQPGIIVPADPRPGMRYRQEYYKGQAEDNGAVLSTYEMAETPYGRFKGALLTKDTDALEPNVLEYKLYAKGVGPVLALGVSGGSGREELLGMDEAPRSAGTGPLGNPDP